MKKTIALTITTLLVAAVGASAATITVPLYAGLNMLAAPQVPINSAPDSVFMDSNGNSLNPAFNLTRYDAATQGYIPFSPFSSDFGGVLLGDGAWLAVDNNVTWQYDAAPNGLPDATTNAKTDMWISLPVAGLTLFGNPFNDSIDWATCQMTDGTQTVSLSAAADLGWFDGSCTEYDGPTQGYITVGLLPWNQPNLNPGHAYWIQTSVPNLALIIPAVP